MWNNLDSFLTAAENNGIYVVLEFVNSQVLNALKAGTSSCSTIETTYETWAEYFISHFDSGHNNIVAWGLNWSWVPDGSYSCTNSVWAYNYTHMKTAATASYSSPPRPLLAQIGVAFGFGISVPGSGTDIVPRGTGYPYNWTSGQQMAQTMYTLLGSVEPDYFFLGGYNANSGDLYSGLNNLINSTTSGGRKVPANKIVFTEFGISTGLTEAISGHNSLHSGWENIPAGWYAYASLADNQVPITGRTSQSQWLQNTVCAFRSAGTSKQAYWTMYDPYTWWSSPSYDPNNDSKLALQGFWGLITEDSTPVQKPAWTTLTNFNQNTLTCPPVTSATPVLEVHADTTYYTISQPIGFYWTATDFTSLSLSQSNNGSFSCISGSAISTALDGSCAYTVAGAFHTTGSQTVTMTAHNGSASSTSKTATVTIGAGPVITAITNSSYGSYITSSDTIIVWGEGFSVHGGNTVQLHNNTTNSDYWQYETDGRYFWDNSYTQINAALGGVPPAGSYTVYARNSFSGTPSVGFALTIH